MDERAPQAATPAKTTDAKAAPRTWRDISFPALKTVIAPPTSGSAWRVVLGAWLRRHALALGLLLAACALGQIETLSQTPLVQGPGLYPDTATYLTIAHRILNGGALFDLVRTPGYPLFLAFVFALTGKDNVTAVVIAQALLLIVAILQVYTLIIMLSGRRSVALIAAAAIATNTTILQWERAILSEALAVFWVVTCVWALTLYLRAHSWPAVAALVISVVAATLTRPSLVFLPAVLFGALLLRAWYLHTGRQVWRQALVGLMIAYGLVGLYSLGNGLVAGYYGLSSVGSYNLFGKAFEYHLEANPGGDPDVASMRADMLRYLAGGGTTVNGFYAQYPYYGQRQGAGIVARYAWDVALTNPVVFIQDTFTDMRVTLVAPPHAYAPITPNDTLIALSWLAQDEVGMYSLWPLLLLVPALALARRRENDAALILLLLPALALVNVALVAADAANEFYRLRAIFDWAVLTAAWTLAGELVAIVGGAESRLLGVPTGVSVAAYRPPWPPFLTGKRQEKG